MERGGRGRKGERERGGGGRGEGEQNKNHLYTQLRKYTCQIQTYATLVVTSVSLVTHTNSCKCIYVH